MLLLATLLLAARGEGAQHAAPLQLSLLVLAFVTVLFGALTANLGAASACGGFPLCNGQVWTTAGQLAVMHWTHRLLAYSLTIVAAIWAARSRRPGPAVVLLMIVLQVIVGATMVVHGLPRV